MKLLNLNIGIKIDNTKDVIKLISDGQYDIVALQEVMKKIENTVLDKYNSSNIIRENTNYKYSFFGPLWFANHQEKNGIITRNFGGLTEQGNEILSKYPITYANNIFYYKNYSEFKDTTNFRKKDHPRAFINAILEINNKQLQIINIHGTFNQKQLGNRRTILQTKEILSQVRNDIPCIITGDFNLRPNTKSIRILSKSMINLIEKYNIKSTRPINEEISVCDYIFVNNQVKVNDFKVLNCNISDHLPLILDFDI